MGILSFFLVNTIQAAQKSVDDETVEGSANVDNPDDEDFEVGFLLTSYVL